MSNCLWPMDCSRPGSSVHGIFQARIPEWVFSFPSPGDLPDPGIEPASLASPTLASRFFTISATWEAPNQACLVVNIGLYLLDFTLLLWFRYSSYSILVLALWILSVFPTFLSATKLRTDKEPSSKSCRKGFFLIQLLVSKKHSPVSVCETG